MPQHSSCQNGAERLLLLFLPSLIAIAPVVIWKDCFLSLKVLPNPDMSDRQIAGLCGVEPLRLRITIRGMFVAIAAIALCLAAGMEYTKYLRRDIFRYMASHHARLESEDREDQKRSFDNAVEFEKMGAEHQKKGWDSALSSQFAARDRKSAAGYAAKADYHAAMKIKYEQAITEGRITLEPDPTPPP